MATEMPAAIRPYSIAVAPLSSWANFSKRDFNIFPPMCWMLVAHHGRQLLRSGFALH
jgi:hypothetical protein